MTMNPRTMRPKKKEAGSPPPPPPGATYRIKSESNSYILTESGSYLRTE